MFQSRACSTIFLFALGSSAAWQTATAQTSVPLADSTTGRIESLVADPSESGPIDVSDNVKPVRLEDGRIQVGDVIFDTWIDYHMSSYFQRYARRCGTTESDVGGPRAPGDCSMNGSALGDPSYTPTIKYRIPVVIHCIQPSGSGTNGDPTKPGYISFSNALGQIAILNEDFQAIAGSNGALGNDAKFEFYLANITYSYNAQWFIEQGNYWDSLAWDTTRYVNVYTFEFADPSLLGRVSGFPAAGFPSPNEDRVMVRWDVFGPEAPDPTANLGRTLTHEMGHYFGLFHTFSGCGASTLPGCQTSGDLICDTPPEAIEVYGCADFPTCGVSRSIDNYMSYSDDLCMRRFTPEQVRRMRCTILNYRTQLYSIADPNAGACCRLNGNCIVTAAADCASQGGAFQGPGLTCSTSTCSASVTASDACDPNNIITTSFSHSGTTTGAANDYTGTTSSCGTLVGADSSSSPDVVYAFRPGVGNVSVNLAPTSISDLSVYAITDCANVAASCVGGDDLGTFGESESFTFAAQANKTYFIIVDGYGPAAPLNQGTYTLSVQFTPTVLGACCTPSGGCDVGSEGQCAAFGGTYKGNGTTCANANCPQPPPTGACCDPEGNCIIVNETACLNGAGEYAGDFSVCNPSPCSDPFGACCQTDDTCVETLRSLCNAAAGKFLGVNTTCSAPLCADIPGACCLISGACESLKQAECAAVDGLFRGQARACGAVICPQPTGACCTTDSPCALRTKAACESEGGTYKGDQTACTPAICPAAQEAPTGACCKANGTCENVEQADCASLGGTYKGNGISCSQASCPQPMGACCFGTTGCQQITESACVSGNGTFTGDGVTCAEGCNDLCPNDPEKTAPGECGCGVSDDDSDGDGTPDCHDNCPDDPNKIQPGSCGCGSSEANPCPGTEPPGPFAGICGGGSNLLGAELLLVGIGCGVVRKRRRRRKA